MLENTVRPWWQKRVLRVSAGLIVFILLFMVAIRITVTEMFRGIEQSRAMGLAALSPWEPLSHAAEIGRPCPLRDERLANLAKRRPSHAL